MPPQLSVIVPVRDDAAGLAVLLESLAGQTLARDAYEVIVVANACRDESADVARAAGARVVEDPLPGRGRARNLGAAQAAGDRLVFTDADCVARAGWLEALLGCADAAPLVAGAVTITTAERPGDVERFERLWRSGQQAWVEQGWAATANLMIAREAFDAIGGFDTAYRHLAEDGDLCIRAGRAGFRLAYCGEAEVLHPAERELAPMLRRAFWHGYSSAQARRRIGVGERAWRRPAPLLRRRAALAEIGHAQVRDRRLSALARAAWAARMGGALYADARRAG
jgi:GT2 family glycosyltransferase